MHYGMNDFRNRLVFALIFSASKSLVFSRPY